MSTIPFELRYDQNHQWAQLLGDGSVRTGVTNQAVRSLTGMGMEGSIRSVQLPAVGQVLAAGADCGAIEGSRAVAGLYSPIAGTVSQVNTALSGEPDTVRQDYYGDGWLYKLTPTNPADVNSLMDAAAYEDFVLRGG
jgi:glycine cleavage system H protein